VDLSFIIIGPKRRDAGMGYPVRTHSRKAPR
jgi:hypothetical protein